jgi:hypothetical protein
MKDPRQFVDARLTAMHARPRIWAWSKEAFALQIILLIEIALNFPEAFDAQSLLQKFLPDTTVSSKDWVDDTWARSVIEIVRKELT